MAGGWRISPPFLSDADREKAVTGRLADEPEANQFSKAILLGLQGMRNIYAGTVDPVTIAHRRKRNKAARRSRRINRQAAKR